MDRYVHVPFFFFSKKGKTDIPSDLGALVVLAGKLSDHDGAHMLLAALSMILASSSSARNSFHPEGCACVCFAIGFLFFKTFKANVELLGGCCAICVVEQMYDT